MSARSPEKRTVLLQAYQQQRVYVRHVAAYDHEISTGGNLERVTDQSVSVGDVRIPFGEEAHPPAAILSIEAGGKIVYAHKRYLHQMNKHGTLASPERQALEGRLLQE